MTSRLVAVVFAAALGSLGFAGCGGDGSATHLAAIPAASKVAPAPGKGAVRRTQSLPTCSSAGTDSFVGIANQNVAGGVLAVVGGGDYNQACDGETAILGGFNNAISSGSDTSYDAVITAGSSNSITGSSAFGAIVGGFENALSGGGDAFIGGGSGNQISSSDGVITGGSNNIVSNTYGIVAGGVSNTVSGQYGFIGGGTNNSVAGEGAFIASGGYNSASGEGAVIDGGFQQTASGTFATIPGGYRNSAGGTYSFAAGAFASAAKEGSFVWSDGSNGDTALTSSQAYQFLARAAGGFTLYTNAAATVGAQLAPGSGAWASLSDRDAKTDIVPLDDAAVLEKVAALPISRWSYRTERGVRHIGPMAQDFYSAFAVGEDDRHITSIDEDGVALAAIQALRRENQALHARLGAQSAQIAAMQAQIRSLTAAVATIRAARTAVAMPEHGSTFPRRRLY
ncbi:MAG TPA: tail fiber domain-containing protein [Candidatus Baltobacteraceae bacterium]|nr:tail fiber domain-containing protein [Candidatus Baltobacteraceae bacterium]